MRSSEGPTLSIKIRKPWPNHTQQLATIDRVNRDLVSIETDTQLNGGFGTARLGMAELLDTYPAVRAYLPVQNDVEERCHIEVLAGAYRLHVGVLQTTEEPGGQVRGLTSLGYGLAAGGWASYSNTSTAEAPQRTILLDMLKQSCPWLTPANIANQATKHVLNELDNMTVAAVLERMVKEGNETDDLFYWTVYDSNLLTFAPKIPPSIPRFELAVRDHDIPRRDYSQVVDAVRSTYTKDDGTEGVTDYFYSERVTDRTNTYLIRKTLPLVLSKTHAVKIAHTYLKRFEYPLVSLELVMEPWDTLTSAAEGQVEGYQARAGDWCNLRGYGKAQITRTQNNWLERRTTIQIGEPSSDTMAWYGTRQAETIESMRANISPIAGNRLRK